MYALLSPGYIISPASGKARTAGPVCSLFSSSRQDGSRPNPARPTPRAQPCNFKTNSARTEARSSADVCPRLSSLSKSQGAWAAERRLSDCGASPAAPRTRASPAAPRTRASSVAGQILSSTKKKCNLKIMLQTCHDLVLAGKQKILPASLIRYYRKGPKCVLALLFSRLRRGSMMRTFINKK